MTMPLHKRLLAPLTALALAALAGVAAAALTAGPPHRADAPPLSDHHGDTAAPTDDAAVDATTRVANRPAPIGVLVYTSRGGNTCVAYGQVRGRDVGAFEPDGRFRALPLDEGADCITGTEPANTLLIHRSIQGDDPAVAGDSGGTTVWGLASRAVRTVRVTIEGRSATSRVGARGAYVVAWPSAFDGTEAVVEGIGANGSVLKRVVMPAGPSHEHMLQVAEAAR
jgi:hypothetical protein